MSTQIPTDAQLGLQLRAARLYAGISQTELARRLAEYGLDISNASLCRAEAGKRQLCLRESVAMADALGCSLVELTDVSGSSFAAKAVKAKMADLQRQMDQARRELEEVSA